MISEVATGLVQIVRHFNRLGIHATHDAMRMTHDSAHDVIHDGWLRIQQRLQLATIKDQHLTIGFSGDGGADLRNIAAHESDDAGQTIRLLFDEGVKMSNSLSPDGTKMAINDFSEGQNIAYYDFTTKERVLITHHTWYDKWTFFPVWSPDGKELAYIKAGWANIDPYGLWVSTLDGKERLLYFNPAPGSKIFPCDWLPNGSGVVIVLQDSSGLIQPGTQEGLEILGHVEDLGEQIRRCDLVVVPYHEDAYRIRGSAIVWEAIANGVPLVAPDRTSSGNLIAALGCGRLFGEFSTESIVNTIRLVHAQYRVASSLAQVAARRWSDHHGIRRYVDRLLAAERD